MLHVTSMNSPVAMSIWLKIQVPMFNKPGFALTGLGLIKVPSSGSLCFFPC